VLTAFDQARPIAQPAKRRYIFLSKCTAILGLGLQKKIVI